MIPTVQLRSKQRYNDPGLRIYENYLQQVLTNTENLCLQNSTFWLSRAHGYSNCSSRPTTGKPTTNYLHATLIKNLNINSAGNVCIT
jgi:hypothetical protein